MSATPTPAGIRAIGAPRRTWSGCRNSTHRQTPGGRGNTHGGVGDDRRAGPERGGIRNPRAVQSIEAALRRAVEIKCMGKAWIARRGVYPRLPKGGLARSYGAPRGNRTPNPLILAAGLSAMRSMFRI